MLLVQKECSHTQYNTQYNNCMLKPTKSIEEKNARIISKIEGNLQHMDEDHCNMTLQLIDFYKLEGLRDEKLNAILVKVESALLRVKKEETYYEEEEMKKIKSFLKV